MSNRVRRDIDLVGEVDLGSPRDANALHHVLASAESSVRAAEKAKKRDLVPDSLLPLWRAFACLPNPKDILASSNFDAQTRR